MRIADIIANETIHASEDVELLRSDVRVFLNRKELSPDEILAGRVSQRSSPFPSENHFRSRERRENTRLILQHLDRFLEHIPGNSGGTAPAAPAFKPFMDCVRFEVDLLRSDDVHDAVFNEINLMGSTSGDNVWDYMRRTIDKNRELNELLVTGSSDEASNFLTLCLALEELCLFWFDVRQEDMRRIRFGDILIFKLARILQARCRQA